MAILIHHMTFAPSVTQILLKELLDVDLKFDLYGL